MLNKIYLKLLNVGKSFTKSPFNSSRHLIADAKKDFNSSKNLSKANFVWCAGLPKSGTTLIEEIFENLPYVSLNNSLLRNFIPGKLDHEHGISELMFSNIPQSKYTFIKTHSHYDIKYENIAKKYNAKIIISTRDIRDMLISRYYHIFYDKKHWLHERVKNLPFDEGFLISLKEKSKPNLDEPIKYYYNWINDWVNISNERNYLLLWYEEYLINPTTYINKILKYINFTNHSAADIEDKLKRRRDKMPSFEKSINKYGRLKSTYREGKSKNWKIKFNDKINEFFHNNLPQSIDKVTFKENE